MGWQRQHGWRIVASALARVACAAQRFTLLPTGPPHPRRSPSRHRRRLHTLERCLATAVPPAPTSTCSPAPTSSSSSKISSGQTALCEAPVMLNSAQAGPFHRLPRRQRLPPNACRPALFAPPHLPLQGGASPVPALPALLTAPCRSSGSCFALALQQATPAFRRSALPCSPHPLAPQPPTQSHLTSLAFGPASPPPLRLHGCSFVQPI